MHSIKTKTPRADWKPLLRRLKRQKAVLLLGPEVVMANHPQQPPLKEALLEFIHDDLKGRISDKDLQRIEYYSEDGFCYYEDSYKTEVVDAILAFYEELELTELHRQVAQLPFHCILSLSPDHLLCQAFEELGLPYTFHYYNKSRYAEQEDDAKLDFEPSLQNRLIYNLFGSIEDEDSLIVSYEDLFTFLEKIFNNHKLPKTVREVLLSANCFVFVGFNYGKWYLKLLLRMLNIHDKMRKKYGMDIPARETVQTFFINEFDMNFTGIGAGDFVQELFGICQQKGLLVQAPEQYASRGKLPNELVKKVRKQIRLGYLDAAFDELLDYTEQQPDLAALDDALIQLSSRWAQLKRENTLEGVVRYDDFKIQTNRITKALLELVGKYVKR